MRYFAFASYAFLQEYEGRRDNNWRISLIEKIAKVHNREDISNDPVAYEIEEVIFGKKRSIFTLIKNELFWRYHAKY